MEKVYIILVNYNNWEDTIECLESVFKSTYPCYQVIVIDNDSPNNSILHLVSWAEGRQEIVYDKNDQLKKCILPFESKPIKYTLYNTSKIQFDSDLNQEDKSNPLIFIKSNENNGFSAGNNIGIKYAMAKGDADYIWLLNNDTVIERDTLESLVKKSRFYKDNNKKIGIIGAKLMLYDNPNVIQGVGGIYKKLFSIPKHYGELEEDCGQYDHEQVIQQISYPIGASLFIFPEFIKDVGLMCEDYFLYYEELDWVLRGKAKGWELGYCWEAKIFHKEGQSIGASSRSKEKSKISEYCRLKNKIVFTKKFYPQFLWSVRLGFIGVLINRIRRMEFDRVWIVFKAIFG